METYRTNFPEAHAVTANVENLNANEILSSRGLKPGQIDCLVGGPPCQAFSVNNHKRSSEDYRASLVYHYLRLVSELKPESVLIENVPGLLSVKGNTIDTIVGALSHLGYSSYPIQLCASDLGIPQTRKRLLIFASRTFEPQMVWRQLLGHDAAIRITHSGIEHWTPSKKRGTNIGEALDDLPELENGSKTGDFEYTKKQQLSAYQIRARQGSKGITNHSCSRLGKDNLQRLEYISQGGNWRSIPESLLPAGMRRAKKSDHTKRYGRLMTEGLSGTILTKCDPHWGAYFHPLQDRVISVREAARLQSFRDVFVLADTGLTAQYRGIGNAVPPILARNIAKAIENIKVTQ